MRRSNAIIHYSEDIDGDLSLLPMKEFLFEMGKVAEECYRVLKKDKFCAILMGDMRQKGMVKPLAFETMREFEFAGFKIKEQTVSSLIFSCLRMSICSCLRNDVNLTTNKKFD